MTTYDPFIEIQPCMTCGAPTQKFECEDCENGAAEIAAYTIGAQHAEAGKVWDTATEDSAQLMQSFGEWGATTEANADKRGRICDAYNEGIASVIDPGEEGTHR